MQQHVENQIKPASRDRVAVAIFLLITGIVLVADLAVKQWSFEHVAGRPVSLTSENAVQSDVIPPHNPVRLIPNVLSLKLTVNSGAVFGIGAGGRLFFIVVTVVAVISILAIFWRSQSRQRVMHVGLAFVLAGALGNLYDRIVFTVVRDMLYLFPGVRLPLGLSWPGGNRELYPWIFNIADVALCVGVGLILLTLLRKPPQAASCADQGHS